MTIGEATSQEGDNTASVEVPQIAVGLTGLGLRGILLMVFTAGLYRFWYITQLRAYFWYNTKIAGFPLEYTGQPIELITGFCIAVAVLLPLYLVFFILSLGLEYGVMIANIGAFLALWFLSEYAVFRARRYRLTRTLYRGLRFNQSTRAAKYAAMSMVLWLGTIASLGWLWPMRRKWLQAYRTRHTSYGTFAGSFSCKLAPLYSAAWPLLMSLSLIFLTSIWLGIDLWQTKLELVEPVFSGQWDSNSADAGEYLIRQAAPKAIAIIGLILLALVCFGPRYSAAEFRIFANGTAFGPIQFSSTLRAKQMLSVWAKFVGVLALCGLVYWVIGLIMLSIMARSSLAGAMVDSASARYSVLAVLGMFYLVGVVLYSLIHLVLMRFALWRVYASSLRLHHIDQLETARADKATKLRNRDGWSEGFADALDVGGF
ncbi:MAG: hypothetical protein COA52_02210 [Hyphomicrobiales bacterium]|nr:MAG: hypothetical protein COA52_02210 [Hyphomicrobiales bacterium]